MANEKKNTTTNECDSTSKPLFTGDYIRDTSVSEGEKMAEASQATLPLHQSQSIFHWASNPKPFEAYLS